MKTPLETKTAAVAAIPANSTLVIFAAVVAGNPTAAQVETARYSVAANLENVGATATSAYLTRFEPVVVDVDADESLLLTVDATLSKVGPDPLPDAAEPDSLDDAPVESGNENDATSSDAAAIAEPAAEPEASEA
ncbi:MAG: hypothetical protein IJY15_08840 [Thermoguttaceae bacterium]|nr:hypothetical protein [Thermoguttaceae bacterium]